MAVFSVVLHSDTSDHFYEAVSFAAAAWAQGKTVLFFLRGEALAAYVNNDWKDPGGAAGKGLRARRGPSSEETLSELRAKGKVRVYACSAWVQMLGLDGGAVAARVDAVTGLNAFLSQSEGGAVIYV